MQDVRQAHEVGGQEQGLPVRQVQIQRHYCKENSDAKRTRHQGGPLHPDSKGAPAPHKAAAEVRPREIELQLQLKHRLKIVTMQLLLLLHPFFLSQECKRRFVYGMNAL